MKGCRMLGWLLRPFPHCRREVSEVSCVQLPRVDGEEWDVTGGHVSDSLPPAPSLTAPRSV